MNDKCGGDNVRRCFRWASVSTRCCFFETSWNHRWDVQWIYRQTIRNGRGTVTGQVDKMPRTAWGLSQRPPTPRPIVWVRQARSKVDAELSVGAPVNPKTPGRWFCEASPGQGICVDNRIWTSQAACPGYPYPGSMS